MDDDELFREALRVVLEGVGYEVLEAPDGEVGLRLQRRTGQVEVLRAAAALGASRTLLKPFQPRELLKAVQELLGQRASS